MREGEALSCNSDTAPCLGCKDGQSSCMKIPTGQEKIIHENQAMPNHERDMKLQLFFSDGQTEMLNVEELSVTEV